MPCICLQALFADITIDTTRDIAVLGGTIDDENGADLPPLLQAILVHLSDVFGLSATGVCCFPSKFHPMQNMPISKRVIEKVK